MFTFCCNFFSFVVDATKNKTGFDIDLDVFGNGNVDTAECAKGFDDGVLFEFGIFKIQINSAKDGNNVGTLEDFVVISAFVAGKNGGLGVHDFAIFEVFNFFADFFVAVCVEDTANNNAETDSNEDDSKDDFPGDIVREDVPSRKEENDADADYDET